MVSVGPQLIQVAEPLRAAGSVFVCIRAEDVTLEGPPRDTVSARNRLAGRVTAIQSEGGVVRVTVDCGFPLSALITKPALQELRLDIDSTVTAAFKATAAHLIPREPT